MIDEFWKGVSGKLAERWAGALSGPSALFWCGVAGVIVAYTGFNKLVAAFSADTTPQKIAILFGLLVLVVVSPAVAEPLTPVALKFLEGYGWPKRIRKRRQNRVKARMSELQAELWQLQEQERKAGAREKLAEDQRARIDELELALSQAPAKDEEKMPTRLGNVLRAAEVRPRDFYGLDPIRWWPLLWLLLPDSEKSEIASARASLDLAARIWIWSVFFAVASVAAAGTAISIAAVQTRLTSDLLLITAATLLGGLIAAAVSAQSAYSWAISVATLYGSLLNAAFDLHRTELYSALRYEKPASPALETESGMNLTAVMVRGAEDETPYADEQTPGVSKKLQAAIHILGIHIATVELTSKE